MSGCFITFEGVEGCGKSTQIALLWEYLTEAGYDVIVTREPGGTPIAEAIRGVLLNPDHENMGPAVELLLYAAARAQHVFEKIAPALAAGQIVLCDRFADSTTAYQGAGRGLHAELLHTLNEIATGGVWPDCTLLIDVPVTVGLERARSRGRKDRIEQESIDFHERVRQGFLSLAASDHDRIHLIPGEASVDEVHQTIRRAVEALLAARVE
ncbi:MAG: dTMP kinase [Candidatus Hydrogenedentes bacterium]|nr:dTMP kinase [Candidatus Hydrogenedentota bacterium]